MRSSLTALLAVCLLLVPTSAFAQNSCAPAGTLSFPVTLAGSQFGGSGSATGFGTGFITLNPANNTATLQLSTNGLGPNITSAALLSNGSNVLSFFNGTNQSSLNGGFD